MFFQCVWNLNSWYYFDVQKMMKCINITSIFLWFLGPNGGYYHSSSPFMCFFNLMTKKRNHLNMYPSSHQPPWNLTHFITTNKYSIIHTYWKAKLIHDFDGYLKSIIYFISSFDFFFKKKLVVWLWNKVKTLHLFPYYIKKK